MAKYLRFKHKEKAFWGVLKGKRVVALDRAPWEGGRETTLCADLEKVKILAPTVPTKVMCVGLNFRRHAEEIGAGVEVPKEPLVFLKAPSAVIATGESIVLPRESEWVEYEGEIAVVIGKRGRRIPQERATEYIFGITCANDVTARDIQRREKQWFRAKSFDTFLPLGPFIETEFDPDSIVVKTYLNGKLVQEGSAKDMLFSIRQIVSAVSQVATLMPGDVILCGTPQGTGKLSPGDEVVVEIEQVGQLKNGVVAE